MNRNPAGTARRARGRRGKPLVAALLATSLLSSHALAATCESLAGLSLPTTTITLAQSVAAGTDNPAGVQLPAFCRVTATLTPSPDSNILIEVWLPQAGWNGRYVGTGNGGYAGAIQYPALARALAQGYAVANTDMGMSPNGDAQVGHPQRWIDWGYRATHEMTVRAKQIVRAFYKRHPSRAYFIGCSTGGEQAIMEALRYPDDYDGIVAGAPGNNRTHLHESFVWTWQAADRASAAGLLTKLGLVNQSVLASCGGQDGAPATDAFLTDPRDCHFDPKDLQCSGADGPNCLTAAQVTAMRQIYDGPRNPRNGHLIYPGWQRGNEDDPFGLGFLIGGAEPAFDSLFKWVFGLNWNPRTFTFDTGVQTVDATLAPNVNANNPDLSDFARHGGKLLIHAGWGDWIVSPQDTIDYYERMIAANAPRHGKSRARGLALARTQAFARLFVVPGMGHCGITGPGFTAIGAAFGPQGPQVDPAHDVLSAIRRWVEAGGAPDRVIATKYLNNDPTQGVAMQRPVCAYPKQARYVGRGDPADASSFRCVTDDRDRNPAPAPEYLH
jgi:Tannase and feruloyl esterase